MITKLLIPIALLLFTFTTFNTFAQGPQGSSYNISGKVLEKSSNAFMEYCTVSLYNKKDSSLVTGGITDLDGLFSINTKEPGIYYLKVSFIGFNTILINDISLNPKTPTYNTGNILLDADAEQVKGVEITATRSTIRYEIDKKVISIDKNIQAESGTAVDVLESTPSIEVDIDGTVKLRGNSNFLVLVDGKPTTLSGSEALQQIPASSIKNIEIITNPSAKYAAGNTAGIINIILKEEKKIGTSGLISASAGTFKNYNGTINIKHNIKKFTFDFSARIRNYAGPQMISDSIYTAGTDELYTLTDGEKTWTFGGYNFNYGIGYKIAKGHKIDANLSYGKWYMLVDNESIVYRKNITQNISNESKTINDTYRGSPYYGPSLSYSGTFNEKTNVSAYIGFTQSDFTEEVINDYYNINNHKTAGTKTAEKGDDIEVASKLDFTIPIKEGKLELGGQSNHAIGITNSNAYDLDTTDSSYKLTDYDNDFIDFRRDVFGLYANYSNEFKKFTYSLGFRAEYTDRKMIVEKNQASKKYFKWNYFPTAHLGINIDESQQVYLSYTTRIQRPPGWQIQPQTIKNSANSYFEGNEDLTPEIVNSIDFGWNKSFKKGTRLSFELFYDLYQNHIEFITAPYINNTTLMRPVNAGDITNIGLEASFGTNIFKWWNTEISGTSYYSIYDIEVASIKINRKTFEWDARINNYFTITKSTKLQLTTQYWSTISSALGYEGDRLSFGLGIKQSFLKKALNISLNARNILKTEKYYGKSLTDNYYYSYENKPKWPRVTLSLSYKINNYRPERKQNESRQGQL